MKEGLAKNENPIQGSFIIEELTDLVEKAVLSEFDRITEGEGSKAALVYGQMNEPPGARSRVALTGLTVAEYFRDQEGQDVLFFVDNIFRFTQAGSCNFTRIYNLNNTITRRFIEIEIF